MVALPTLGTYLHAEHENDSCPSLAALVYSLNQFESPVFESFHGMMILTLQRLTERVIFKLANYPLRNTTFCQPHLLNVAVLVKGVHPVCGAASGMCVVWRRPRSMFFPHG